MEESSSHSSLNAHGHHAIRLRDNFQNRKPQETDAGKACLIIDAGCIFVVGLYQMKLIFAALYLLESFGVCVCAC